MDINGNLKVFGTADMCLPVFSKDTNNTIRNNQIFFNTAGKLCFKYDNQSHCLANLADTDLTKVFGDFINCYGNLNTSAINEITQPLFNFKNNENMLDLIRYMIKSIEDIKQNVELAKSNKSESPKTPFPHVQGDGLIKKSGNKLHVVPEYKTLELKTKKRIHIIEHDLDKKYCWVQVINEDEVLMAPSEYKIQFSEVNRFSVTLNTESAITLLIS